MAVEHNGTGNRAQSTNACLYFPQAKRRTLPLR